MANMDEEKKLKKNKFNKRYRQFVEGLDQELPVIQVQNLNTVLRNCVKKDSIILNSKDRKIGQVCNCPQDCPVCDGAFFPSLLDDMLAIVNVFNKRAKELLEYHSASGFQKYFFLLKKKIRGSHVNLVKEDNDMVSYAIFSAVAIQNILEKYDKTHCSTKGHKFKLEAQIKRVELLKSPWLFELVAYHINLKDKAKSRNNIQRLFDCSLHKEDERPSLSVTLFNSAKLNLELTCPICLETVFDPVALSCSHIFCFTCACSAASITIVEGLKAADANISKCPICRQVGVFNNAVHLKELNRLLRQRLRDNWEERYKRERKERLKQVKEHWDFQARAFMGYQ